ncbi:MAG: alpha/beta hydrolase, partial [Ferruginibacter sp.]
FHNMQTKSFQLTGADGHQIPVYAWLPEAEPSCILHIAHGMAEYGLRYAPIAEMLVQQGIAVYAHDHRGHGKAVTTENDLGKPGPNWFYKQVADIQLAIAYLKKLHPSKKIFLLGHSMGSFICQRYFQMHGNDIDGLILSATNGKQDPLLGIGILVAKMQMKIFGDKYRSDLINKLSFQKFNTAFKPNRTAFDWLSRNPKEVDAYVADKQCGYVCSALLFYYLFKGIKDAFSKENIQHVPLNVPVYAFAGNEDPVGLQGKGLLELVRNWQKAGVKDITYHLYKDGRHEMLNEINREEVVDDLINWIKQHT